MALTIPKLSEVKENALSRFLPLIGRVYTFIQERANRAIRFIAITRAYRSGTKVQDITGRYGCSTNTVNRYARLAGLPKRPKHFPEAVKRAVLQDYKSGLPIARIAELNSVSQAYVSTVATEAGINRKKDYRRNNERTTERHR